MGERLRVTTDPAYYEEHSANLELWSPGGLLFPGGPDSPSDASPDGSLDAPPAAPPAEVARYATLKAILDA